MCIRDRPWSPPTDRRRSVSPAGQVLLVVGVLAVLHVPLGNYLARVYTASAHGRVEMLIFRLGRIDPEADQRWPVYLTSLLAFSAVGVGGLYLLLRLQGHLPYSLGHPGMSPALAFDTAAAVALVRGLTRRNTVRVGNFWVDLTRGCLRVAIPLALLGGLALLACGVVQNLGPAHSATGLAGIRQPLIGGPVASWEPVKLLSGDGGGAFNANSAHPFENPSGLSNLIGIVLMLLIPSAFPRAYGVMVGDRRQGWALAAVAGHDP